MLVNRRLYRCRDNRVLAGVAGGVAEYFDVDPSLVRLFWFLSIFVGGFGVLRDFVSREVRRVAL